MIHPQRSYHSRKHFHSTPFLQKLNGYYWTPERRLPEIARQKILKKLRPKKCQEDQYLVFTNLDTRDTSIV